MAREHFTFFESYHESFKDLPPEVVGQIVQAMCAYYFDGEDIELEGLPRTIFSLIRPVLDSSIKKSENGAKGGAPKGNTNALKTSKKQAKNNLNTSKKQAKTSDKDKEKDKDIEKDNSEDNKLSSSSSITDDDVNEIIDCWGRTYTPLSQISPTRFEALMLLLRVFTAEDVKRAIKLSKQSSFLQSKTWFTFDWLIKQDNITKVLDGNYKDREEPQKIQLQILGEKWGIDNDDE